MKKTLINLLLFTAITLLAALFFKNLSFENSQTHIPIIKTEIENSHPVEKSNKKNELKKSTNLSSLANEKNQITIDIVLATDTTNALFTKGRLERSAELVRLADLYTNNALLQYLASVHCINLDENPCDPKRFAQRLLSINPNNAIGKELLITDSLNNNDYETALSLLETIKATDDYSNYFNEVTDSVKNAVEEKLLTNEFTIAKLKTLIGQQATSSLSSIDDEKFQHIATQLISNGVAAAQPINAKVYMNCFKQVKNNPQKYRWINACHEYGVLIQNSTSLNEQNMGLKLQLKMLELNGKNKAAWQVQKTIEINRNIMEASGYIFMKEEFLISKDFKTYTIEFKEFGELEALRRLIKRQSKPKPPP